MTIAACIRCSDGIILCADTEETVTDDLKGNASKIHIVMHQTSRKKYFQLTTKIGDSRRDGGLWHGRGDWIIGMAGAGHADWISTFIQDMREPVLLEMFGRKIDFDKLRNFLTQYAQDFFSKYIKTYAENPSYRPQAQMLVVGQSKNQHEVFRINDNVVLHGEWTEAVAVGKGAPTFQYLAKRLLPSYEYSMKQAASIAVLHHEEGEIRGCWVRRKFSHCADRPQGND